MSQTPDSADGYLVPPLWLEENGITQEELDELKARFLAACHGPIIVLTPRPPRWRWRWWEWLAALWWWYRQYKRADRREFKRECEQIRWRAVWKGDR
jgi:hypothetical protein